MRLKRGILLAATLWGIAGLLEAMPVPVSVLDLSTPDRGAISPYLDRMPFHALCEVVQSAHGPMVQLKSKPGFFVNFSGAADAVKPGRQVVKLRGRAFSSAAKLKLTVSAVGVHFQNDPCSGSVRDGSFLWCVEAVLPVGDAAQEVEIPFDISGPLLCKRCQKPRAAYSIDFRLELTGPEPCNGREAREMGVEFGDIRLETTFPIRLTQTTSNSDRLVKLEREATAKITDWRNKHRQALKSFPRSNEFNAVGFKDWYDPKTPRKSLDNHCRYWSEDELRKMNPGFEIKKLCPLPFFSPDAYPEAEFDSFTESDLSAMEFGNIFYAFDAQGTIIRIDPVSGAREYLKDETIWRDALKRTRTFSDNVHQVIEFPISHKIYRLSDASVVGLPDDICRKDRAFYALTPSHAFWIGRDGKTIYRGNPDFSAPEPLQFKLPELPRIKSYGFTGIFSYGGDPVLLLRMAADNKRRERFEVWLELEPETGLCRLKMPLSVEECSISPVYENPGWVFASMRSILVNPGPGHMFATVCGDKPEWQALFPPSPLKLDGVPLNTIRQSLRFGGYLCAAVQQPNRCLFYNMVHPEESLMLYGVSGGFHFSPDRKALRFSNFDGLYEVRPLKPAVLPEPLPPPEIPSTDLRLSEVITAIEPEEPALFDAEIVKNKQDKEHLVFYIKPVVAQSNLTLKLKLPPLPDGKKDYYLHFDRPWEGVYFQLRNADGSGNFAAHRDKTVIIPRETTSITVSIYPGHPAKTVTLLAISPESEYYD